MSRLGAVTRLLRDVIDYPSRFNYESYDIRIKDSNCLSWSPIIQIATMSSEDEVVGPLRDLIFDPKPVTRTTTHSSSDSDESDSLNDVDPPSISHIYTNANQYEKVLSYTGCIQSRRSDADGANGFHDLVEKDLDSSEQVIASRFTKLRVAGETWIPGDLTAEPDSYEADKDDESSSDDSVDNIESKGPVLHRAATSDGDSWKLEPDEIIPLLIEEFGPLAEEGEEEKLILETDGCLIQDVIIVVHPFTPYYV